MFVCFLPPKIKRKRKSTRNAEGKHAKKNNLNRHQRTKDRQEGSRRRRARGREEITDKKTLAVTLNDGINGVVK